MEPWNSGLAAWLGRAVRSLGRAYPPAAETPATAVFLGEALPAEALHRFQRVIVDPDCWGSPEDLAAAGVEAYARISLGARAPSGTADQRGAMADPANPDGLRLLLESRMVSLWQQGYRGFFLDGLDGGEPLPDAGRRDDAMVRFVLAAHERFPGVKLLAQRGLRILPRIAPKLAGLVAGPLFRGWDSERREYVEVPEAERLRRLKALREAREQYRLPVAVVDYLPPSEREAARGLAWRIRRLGFSPWIGNAGLDVLGVDGLEDPPRKILALYDGGEFPVARNSPAGRWLAPTLKYMGFAVEPLDVRGPLPAYPLTGCYAGIAAWFTSDALSEPGRYRDWLVRQMDSGMRVALLGRLGFPPDGEFLRRVGLMPAGGPVPPLRYVRRGDFALFEAEPDEPWGASAAFAAAHSSLEAHQVLSDAEGRYLVAVAVGPWGGVAVDPFVIEPGGPSGRSRWRINPFKFLGSALRLPVLPEIEDETPEGEALGIPGGAGPQPARLRGV
jgi:hypothetical protein